MPYKFIEDVAIADIAFEATGKDLAELFQSAAQAVIESMANTKTVKPAVKKEIEKKAKDIETLLFEFLEEIVYLKDKDAMVFHDVKVKVNDKEITLKATLTGDEIKPTEQELHQDVKAITMHQYKVEKNKEWKARVVLDI
ncbi:MAG TPA: archease [Candidatus Nanoarchaeia archaeon]|nr:archease [Candidatus Nanoarchaeia archaeon]